jgi:hypothetical protein
MSKVKKAVTKFVKFSLYCNALSENNPNGDGSWKYGPSNMGAEVDFGNGQIVTEEFYYRNPNGQGWITHETTRDYTGWKRTRLTLPVEFIGMEESEVTAEGFPKHIKVDVFADKVAMGDGIEPIE